MYWSTSLTGTNLLQVQSGHLVQPTPVQICWLTTHSNLKSTKTGWNRSKVPLSRDSSGRQEKVPFVKNKSRTLSLNWFTENLRRNQCFEVEVRSSQQPDALLTAQFCWLLLALWNQFSWQKYKHLMTALSLFTMFLSDGEHTWFLKKPSRDLLFIFSKLKYQQLKVLASRLTCELWRWVKLWYCSISRTGPSCLVIRLISLSNSDHLNPAQFLIWPASWWLRREDGRVCWKM